MVTSAALRLGEAHREQLSSCSLPQTCRAAVLLELARFLCQRLELDAVALSGSRLAALAGHVTCSSNCRDLFSEYVALPGGSVAARRLEAARLLGKTLDLLQASEAGKERRKTGSYFTPSEVAEDLIAKSLKQVSLQDAALRGITVCDPACGGGAFLVEASAQLSARGASFASVVDRVYGIDLSEVALATTQVALWMLVGDPRRAVDAPERFICGDALWGTSFAGSLVDDAELSRAEDSRRLDFPRTFPELGPWGFDWIVGNPPWVAFQGRATQKIVPERRAFYRKHFSAFSGYPTLHGMFVERAASLAPRGHLSLLLPSSLSDLDGYKNTRASLRRAHTAAPLLPEYGQDAFEGVVQPCFGLIARPGADEAPLPGRPWTLAEKSHASAAVVSAAPPDVLGRFEDAPVLSRDTFREVGFQSNRVVVERLFYRGDAPPQEFNVPLLEGRNVGEFVERSPRLFLNPDERVLKEAKARLKDAESYQLVDVVVRQTAAFTIAARHGGARFRNSLIGAFGTDEVSADLLVGLLNSALYRALHVMRQRDARQAAFPQVKVSHLRRLPAPPKRPELLQRIEEQSRAATESRGLGDKEREMLNRSVFELFDVSREEQRDVLAFLATRAPGAVRGRADK